MHDALGPRAHDGAGRRPEALPQHGSCRPEAPPQGRPNEGDVGPSGCCLSRREYACGTPWREHAHESLEGGEELTEEGVIELKRPLEASTEGDGMGHVAPTRCTWPHEKPVSLAAPLYRRQNVRVRV